jgi:DNA-binding transcriptional MerR regulator
MYTVKELAKMAGITPRTLHFYDEIGLLKPSQVGENGYRYYGEESVLRLQQILLYRQMELPLDEIKKLMGRRDFDVLDALEEHKLALQKRIEQMQQLSLTVDKTIEFLKGKEKMDNQQLFKGLSKEQEETYAKEAETMYDQETVRASNKKWKGYSEEVKTRILQEAGKIYTDMAATIPQGASSAAAQACVERWRKNMDNFWTPNLDQLVGLAELYNQDPRFKANFDKVDARLTEFFREAVRIYVKNQKS